MNLYCALLCIALGRTDDDDFRRTRDARARRQSAEHLLRGPQFRRTAGILLLETQRKRNVALYSFPSPHDN